LISRRRRSIIEGMVLPPSDAWKLVLAIILGGAIFASASARAPRRSASSADLKRLVGSAIVLYAIGGVASLTRHPFVAAFVYAAGITVCALAAWLSRGSDSEWPPRGEEPRDEAPPPEPDRLPEVDWEALERQFQDHARGDRVGSR
jgi:hypothetical protein